jgi:hypothetical protein
MINSYEQFFDLYPKEDFFEFGLNNIITIDLDKATIEWEELVLRVENKSPDLYVRSYGRKGSGIDTLKALYRDVFGININIDGTNNSKPKSMLQNLTGYKVNKTIFNYQISHVYGRTKNVFCFTAPWNIMFIPKIIDPITGHEATGRFVEEFQLLMKNKIETKFIESINDYNKLMKLYYPLVKDWASSKVEPKKQKYITKNFEPIDIAS